MIETKQVEIRDAGTFIPALAIRVFDEGGPESYLLRRAGWGRSFGVYLFPMTCSPPMVQYDVYEWPAGVRTYRVAHEYLRDNWNRVEDGGVVCVEYILGERDAPKESEATV